ncbi:hypothetical protein OSTOST_14412 [Ostertagia ostertagi]
MAGGKKFATCIEKCMDRGTGGCFKKLNCGLALPPDNVLVQTAKQCAIRQGFNTPAIQQLCRCFANAGVRGLAPLLLKDPNLIKNDACLKSISNGWRKSDNSNNFLVVD